MEINTSSLQAGVFIKLFLLLSIISLIPFFFCSPPPLLDYANHLARMHIITHLGDSPSLSQYYSIEWRLLPNLAMDLIVPVLAKIMSVEAATVIFTVLSLLLIASGAVTVHRVLFQHYSLFSLTVFLLLYNHIFLWGFLNYFFTVGLVLWFFVGWIYFHESGLIVRIILFNILASILFISHLHAFGIYAILIMGYELSLTVSQQRVNRRIDWINLSIGASQFIMPLILFSFCPTRNLSDKIDYNSLSGKINGIIDVFSNYSPRFDRVTFVILSIIFLGGLMKRKIIIHQRMILSIILLTGLYFVMPVKLFNSTGADRRLIVTIFIVLIASADWKIIKRQGRMVLIIVFMTLFIIRTGIIIVNWSYINGLYQDVAAAIDKIKPGARLAVAVGIPGSYLDPPISHMVNLAVVRKDVFINSMFADYGHQVLKVNYNTDTPFYKSPSHLYSSPINIYEALPLNRFDYLLLVNPKFFSYQPPPMLEPIYQSSDTLLFKIQYPAGLLN